MEFRVGIVTCGRLKKAFLCLFALYCFNGHANEQDFIIIAHPSVSESTISLTNLRQIFTARKQFWADQSAIKVVMQETKSPMHMQFCGQMLRMFPYQVQRIWQQITYSGQGDAAASVDSNQTMLEFIASNKGSIGYVPADTLLDSRVKILKIQQGEE